jgi:hypothetical protein
VSQEEEYFKKIEAEQKAKLKAQQNADDDVASAASRRELHYHKCGKCGSDMNTETYRGIEIEICPSCNAVLLDPGELKQLAGEDNSAWVSSFFSVFGGKSADGE